MCVYCGVNRKQSKDHIPPSSFYPRENKPRMIKVPACNSCHESFNINERYARSRLVLGHIVHTNNGQIAKEKLLVELKNPEWKGFLRSVINSLKDVELVTPSGLYLGNAQAINVDYDEMHTFFSRLTRGFHYKIKDELLKSREIIYIPLNAESLGAFLRLGIEEQMTICSIEREVSAESYNVCHHGVFHLKHKQIMLNDETYMDCFLFKFYEERQFLTIALPNSKKLTWIEDTK